MKKRNFFVTGLLRLFLTFAFITHLTGCGDDDDAGPLSTELEIAVVDESGNALSNATINLYLNAEDWEGTANSVDSQTSSSDGKVKFKNLEPREYYIDAIAGESTNWGSDIKTQTLPQNEISKLTLELSDSKINFLVGRKEKSYQLTDIRINGFSLFSEIDECEKDNALFFQREANLGLEDRGDLQCEEGETKQTLFSWSFSEDEAVLNIMDEEGGAIVYKVISITNNKMTVETPIPLEGQIVTAEVDFSVI